MHCWKEKRERSFLLCCIVNYYTRKARRCCDVFLTHLIATNSPPPPQIFPKFTEYFQMWVSLGIVTFSSTFPLFLFYCFRSIFSERRCEARRRISGCGWVVFFGSLFLADRLFPRTAQIHFSQAGIVSNLPFFFFFIPPPPPLWAAGW